MSESKVIKKKKSGKKKAVAVTLVIVLATGGAGGAFYYKKKTAMKMPEETKQAQSATAEIGTISDTITGTGNLTLADAQSQTVPSGIEIEEVLVVSGDTVIKGETIATVNKASVLKAMEETQEEIQTLDEKISACQDEDDEETLEASVNGRVKLIYAQTGDDTADVMLENGALMVLSLDGKMAVNIKTAGIKEGDSVTVTLSSGTQVTGTAAKVSGSTVTVTLTDNGTIYDDTVTVTDDEGKELGTGLASGRFIRNADLQNSSYVVVITADTATELLGRTDVAGESISLDGRKFLVIGVLDEDSTSSLTSGMAAMSSSSDEDSDSSVSLEGYIPYSTMTRIADNVLDVTQFYASASREDTLDYAKEALTQELLERFEKDEDAFTVTDQSQIMNTMESVTNTMSLMIGGIAAISLLVGGIGIMNIMLVSVTERTKEIGIRKAIGAGRGTIMLQFLIEALLVSMMGCMIGIGVSWAALKITGQFMQGSMKLVMDMKVVWISVVFSGAIGIVFGLYPANKAARKKPIDALRYSG